MEKAFELIKKQRWESLVTWGLLIALGVTVPAAFGAKVEEIVDPVMDIVQTTNEDVKSLREHNETQMQNSAIVAYNKIFTIDDLDPLTQNGLAIREGLKVKKIRNVLASIDLERTLLFEKYFNGDKLAQK